MISMPDTNVILRYLLEDNRQQFRTVCDVFEKVRSGDARAIILESVLVECVYVLVKFYSVPRALAAEKLAAIMRYRGIENGDRVELVRALELYAGGNMDIVDCILHEKSMRSGYSLFSFDEKLKKISRSVHPR